MKKLAACGAALGLWVATPAHAQSVYQWVDESGQTHYTNTPDEIPKNRRSESVMVMDSAPASPSPTTRSGNPRPPGRPPPPPPQSGSEHGIVVEMPDDGPPPRRRSREREEESARQENDAREAEVRAQWQQAFRGANERVARAKLEEKQAQESSDSMGDGSVTVMDSSRRARIIQVRRDADDRLARAHLEVRAAQDALDSLERDASRNAIPREWRQ